MHSTIPVTGMDFLQQLRAETGHMHRQLESNPLSVALMDPGITLELYGRYLSFMRNVILYSEQILFPVVSPVVNTSGRHKLPAIEQDLSYLGVAPHPVPFQPLCENDSIAAALGSLYVIEGSTLGGKVIFKHITGKLPVSETAGAQFFYGYGSNTGRLWSAFLEDFTSYVTEQKCERASIEAARCLFAAIDDYFEA